MYVPMFKCSTNPRTITAHRWNAVDPVGRLAQPTGSVFALAIVMLDQLTAFPECFYNNEGTWYYAGVYKAFMMGTASVAEWETLSAEVLPALQIHLQLPNWPLDEDRHRQRNAGRT